MELARKNLGIVIQGYKQKLVTSFNFEKAHGFNEFEVTIFRMIASSKYKI